MPRGLLDTLVIIFNIAQRQQRVDEKDFHFFGGISKRKNVNADFMKNSILD
jgi:hypothetical protein